VPEYRKTQDRSPALRIVSGSGIVVRGNDIDTDRIIPARFLKTISFEGMGEHAFADVRFDAAGNSTDHPFNDPRFRSASILVVNNNFGCGSSREHAPQALMRWGIKAIIGESFAEIFWGNCNTLGIPAVTVGKTEIEQIMSAVEAQPEMEMTLDLINGSLSLGTTDYRFRMPEAFLQALVGGTWDSTAVLRQNLELIHKTAGSLPYVTDFA
jgi:3-isopropylmalate/(R)-2-methylmalate dehydratase small subunit